MFVSLSVPKTVKYSFIELGKNPEEGIVVDSPLWLLIQFCGSQGGAQGMDFLAFPSSTSEEHFHSSHSQGPRWGIDE